MIGITTGIVKNNWDEDFPGKLKVEYTLGEPELMETGWIPFMTGYAGAGYGGFQLPEIGTEVVIGFHSGDSRRPIVLGCLWNTINMPPEQTANENNTKKLWKSKGGYQLSIDEDEEKQELSFSDPAGEHTISLSSKEDGLLTCNIKTKTVLQFAGEDFLTVEKGKITINGPVTIAAESIAFETEKDITVSADELTAKTKKALTLKASEDMNLKGKNVAIASESKTELKGMNVEVKPSQGYQLKANQVKLEGVSLEIKGSATGKVESGGILQVKGQMLKLN